MKKSPHPKCEDMLVPLKQVWGYPHDYKLDDIAWVE